MIGQFGGTYLLYSLLNLKVCFGHQIVTQRYDKYCTVCTVSYETWFFPLRFTVHMLHAWALYPHGKSLVCKLQ